MKNHLKHWPFAASSLTWARCLGSGVLLALALAVGCGAGNSSESLGSSKQQITAAGWTDLGGFGPIGGVPIGFSLSVGNAGRLHVWTRDENGDLRRKTFKAPTWTGWQLIGNAPGGASAGAPAAVLLPNGLTAVVAKNNSNTLYWRLYDDVSDTWIGSWSVVGPLPLSVLGSPAVSIVPAGPGQGGFMVWAIGSANNLWHSEYRLDSADWGTWSHSGGTPPDGFSGSPAATMRKDGAGFVHELVVASSTGKLYSRTFTGPTWLGSDWSYLGDSGFAHSAAATATPDLANLDIWALGLPGDKRVYNQSNTGQPSGSNSWSGWSALNGPDSGILPSGDNPVVAAVYRGVSYSQGFDLVVQGNGPHLMYINWYDQPPAAAPLQADKTVNLPSWENNPLVVPPGAAGCGPNGAVFFSVGSAATIWRGSLTCFTSTGGGQCNPDSNCGPTRRDTCDVSYNSPAWPALPPSGFLEPTWGYGTNGDQKIVRVGQTLILIKQATRSYKGSDPQPRGAEYVFRSNNCGATWEFVTVLDPALLFGGAYHNPLAQEGFDYPWTYADPFRPNRLYLTLSAGYSGSAKKGMLLAFTDDFGSTWAWPSPDAGKYTEKSGVSYMTSLPSGKLYIFGDYNLTANNLCSGSA